MDNQCLCKTFRKKHNLTMIDTKWIKIICCPDCLGKFSYNVNLYCKKCNKKFLIVDDIPLLITDVEKKNNPHFEHQIKYFDKAYKSPPLELWQKTYNERIFNLFNPNRKKEYFFLDIGVGGTGYTVIEAAKRGFRSVGCDLSLVGIQKAKYLAKKNNVASSTFWVVCNAETLPFSNRAFDYISANAILEHLPNDRKALREIDRVASSRADAFVTTPLKYRYVWPFFIPLNYIHDKKIGHLRRYDEKTFEKKLKTTSRFKINKIFYTGHLVKTLLFITSQLLRTQAFDKLAERADALSTSKKYGANNISIYLRNY